MWWFKKWWRWGNSEYLCLAEIDAVYIPPPDQTDTFELQINLSDGVKTEQNSSVYQSLADKKRRPSDLREDSMDTDTKWKI